jgi:hypothetical protein
MGENVDISVSLNAIKQDAASESKKLCRCGRVATYFIWILLIAYGKFEANVMPFTSTIDYQRTEAR